MMNHAVELQALQRIADLEGPLAAVERGLAALGASLSEHDGAAVEQRASELHAALASAVEHFARAAREGGVPPQMRRRLALASRRVAAQREVRARATASLDRAIDVLLPSALPPSVYGPGGSTPRRSLSGSLQA